MKRKREEFDAELQQERHELDTAKKNYEKYLLKVARVHFPKYVMLDIGGKRFKTAISTLTNEPNSMLAAMFSGRGFKMEPDDTGAYFIDRDGSHFRHILNYLRGAFDPSSLSDSVKKELVVEAEFFSLEKLVKLIKVLRFSHTSSNGILHWLGTGQGTKSYKNPHDDGSVVVTASDGVSPSQFVSNINQGHRGWCSNGGGKSFTIELKISVILSHYSLHWTRSCNQPCRWIVEGSTDGNNFVCLDEHEGHPTQ